MRSLKTNIVLNFINTLTGILIPVITFPYAARILLPEGIGTVNFLTSIINYVVLFSSLGIPTYAVREIARYRDDINKRNQTTVEILILSFILSLVGYIAVWALGEFIPQVNSNLKLFYVLSLTIIFTTLGVNWFYQAIEDFMFITVRGLIFRIIAAVALFVFVKDSSDLLIYALINVGSSVGNNIINFVHLRKYLSKGNIIWHNLNIWKHLRPTLRLFVFNLITSIYLNLNTVMLGFIQGDKAVGLYTTGYKLSSIILNVVSSLGVVLLPRCSNLLENGKREEFKSITRKSYLLVSAVSLPIIVGLIVLSEPIVSIFFGQEYIPSTAVLAWTAPIILFIGLSNVIGIQILYPQGKENIVIWSTAGGAVFSFILNLLLMPIYSYVGAAISTFVTECVVLVIQVVCGRKYIPFRLFSRYILRYILGALIMLVFVMPICIICEDIWAKVLLSATIGGTVYLVWLLSVKDELAKEILQYFLNIFIKH